MTFAGNTLITSAPASQAMNISVGVSAPATTHTPLRLQASITAGTKTGVTTKTQPASMTSAHMSAWVTLPTTPKVTRSPIPEMSDATLNDLDGVRDLHRNFSHGNAAFNQHLHRAYDVVRRFRPDYGNHPNASIIFSMSCLSMVPSFQ
jgi:hypothetical protein